MTVKELIAELEKCNQDAQVFFYSSEEQIDGKVYNVETRKKSYETFALINNIDYYLTDFPNAEIVCLTDIF